MEKQKVWLWNVTKSAYGLNLPLNLTNQHVMSSIFHSYKPKIQKQRDLFSQSVMCWTGLCPGAVTESLVSLLLLHGQEIKYFQRNSLWNHKLLVLNFVFCTICYDKAKAKGRGVQG